MIKKIRLQGLLSFEDMELELRNLNILIGPNGSGKSNLIEALSLLQALPFDIGEPIRRGGGIAEWINKTDPERRACAIRVQIECPIGEDLHYWVYGLELVEHAGRYVISQEEFEAGRLLQNDTKRQVFGSDTTGHGYELQSLLSGKSQWKTASETITRIVADIAEQLAEIRLYRNWDFGGSALPREHQPADLPPDFLMENARNLALVVNEFDNMGMKDQVEAEFRRFYDRFVRFSVSIFGNRLILNMHEEDLNEAIPATRWSDGMIRYLSLLAILCHPKPPSLICIDEPEIGLHPDILPDLARLIKSASERTQVIITTHSRQLVDEFSDDPEAVVVCERDSDGASRMKRLDADKLAKWLEDYSLGQLWESGEIGGTRF